MQLDRLLTDATGFAAGTSKRQRIVRLTALLQARHGEKSISFKGVEKWFERGSIPSAWLMKVAALPKKPLNLANYA